MSQASSSRPEASEDITSLRGVGPALAGRLARLNIERPVDLLFMLPQRYEDRTRLTPLGGLRAGFHAVIEGEVALAEVVYRRRRSLLVRLTDGTGQLTLRFFYFSRSQQEGLAAGNRIRCFGETRKGPGGLEMIHPEYRLLQPGKEPALETSLTPIYPATEGLQQPRLRNLVGQALEQCLTRMPDWLPEDLLAELNLPSLRQAIEFVHRPPPEADLASLLGGVHPSQRRLALEEMLAHHLSLKQVRERSRTEKAISLPTAADSREKFITNLPFDLTADQRQALSDIETDLAGSHPMMRLVQGDVGCGKTVVAAAAALTVVGQGHQVAIMAPTELLAEQHRDTFSQWFKPMKINVAWLSGSLKKKRRDQAYEAIATGEAAVVIGTHALFQQGVNYHSLGLIIVDEQHRFGVHQRLRLMEKGQANQLHPHQLVMTATPIPRTLAMTIYADLDVSIIRELPPGRQPVRTVALSDQRRNEVVKRVKDACAEGHRAFWVCPLVEDSEVIQSQAAESTHDMLKETLRGISVGLIHGRMSAEEKEKTMKAFADGRIQVLVATTVIEVGVDIPDATLIIIENSERMGLSQLHQLRGRVGRGSEPSTCVLLYRSPLSQLAKRRLNVLRSTTDGFEVAEQDLRLRGPGEVLGIRQTGLMQLRVADLIRDADLAPTVQRIAGHLISESPEAVEQLIGRWVGSSSRYGNV